MPDQATQPEPQTLRRRPGRPLGNQVVADRAQLLAAAARLINANGPDVTLDDIAAEAGVSKPTLYRTIGDKAALVDALTELLIDAMNAAVRTATATTTAPRNAFEAAVRAHLTAVEADRNLYLFVNLSDRSSAQLERLIDRSASPAREVFSAARRAAGLPEAAARTWAYAVTGAFQTVTTMWLANGCRDRDRVARELTELLWDGIAAVGDLG